MQRSALVERPATLLFDLIEAAEDYAAFLPWCEGATILERSDEVVRAELRVRVAGLAFSMRTCNPKRRPEWMAIHLEQGPFRHFEGEWRLRAIGTAGCRVDFRLDHAFDSATMTRVAGPVFERIADTLVDAFVQRALSLPMPAAPGDAPAGR